MQNKTWKTKDFIRWQLIFQKRLGTCKRLCKGNVVNATTKKPDDYVVATGKQYSVKYFINLVCKILKIDI